MVLATLLLAVAVWILVNVWWRPFEPYQMFPIGSLGAVLGTIAACQVPLILLSERCAAMRDRARYVETYMVTANTESDLHDMRDTLAGIAGRLDMLAAGDDVASPPADRQ